jgi:hypothetical protein
MLISCNTKNKNDLSLFYSKKLNTILLLPLYDSETSKPIKIIAYLDGDCSECFKDITAWQLFYDSINDPKDVEFLFYIYTNNEFLLKKRLENFRFNFDYIVDKKNIFFKENSLSYNMNANVFLVDKRNRIRLMGNPITIPELVKIYIKEINEMKHNN